MSICKLNSYLGGRWNFQKDKKNVIMRYKLLELQHHIIQVRRENISRGTGEILVSG